MITYVSKENNLGPDDKIRYIWGLKGPIFYFVKRSWSALTSYIHIKLSFYEIKSFTRALRNTDNKVSVPKCPGK